MWWLSISKSTKRGGTAAAVPGYVRAGMVVGFDLVGGRATLLGHLTQARKQNVAFNPNLVRMMTVFK